MEEGFYLTLPSNASLNIYENNSLTTYTTHFNDVLNIEGEWEVSLTELHYPHNWFTFHIPKKEFFYTYEYTEPEHSLITVSKSYHLPYEDYADIRDITTTISEVVKDLAIRSKKLCPEVIYNDRVSCVEVKEVFNRELEGDCSRESIGFSKGLFEILGFITDTAEDHNYSKKRASKPVPLRNRFDQIYVYTDIILPNRVGDTLAQLLRIVPIKGNPGENISFIFEKPNYFPVVRNQIQSVEIQLRTDTGLPIRFITGRVVAVLHFRRRKIKF